MSSVYTVSLGESIISNTDIVGVLDIEQDALSLVYKGVIFGLGCTVLWLFILFIFVVPQFLPVKVYPHVIFYV